MSGLRAKIDSSTSLTDSSRTFHLPSRTVLLDLNSYFKPFGLSGPVDDNVRRDLFELNQIRNAWVHRSGFADRRLVESCPWLNLKVGDAIRIDHKTTERYYNSVMAYALELIVRNGEYFGVDMSTVRTSAGINRAVFARSGCCKCQTFGEVSVGNQP